MRRAGLLVFAALAGCAGAEARTSTAKPAPTVASDAGKPVALVADSVGLIPGETMAFEVKLAGIPAGEAQLAVGDLGQVDGHRAVVVKSHGETAGAAAILKHAVDDSTTTIDFDTGRPLALDTSTEQGDARSTASARFATTPAGNTVEIVYHRAEDAAPRTLKLRFGQATVHDAHSAMAQLRGWRAKPGDKRSVYVVGGRRVWRVDVTYAGDDTVHLALGNRRAARFTGEAFRTKPDLSAETAKPNRTFTVWLSADADRVPLQLQASTELGEISMQLTDYSR